VEPNPVGSNIGPQLPSFLPSNLDRAHSHLYCKLHHHVRRFAHAANSLSLLVISLSVASVSAERL
jgi:hypothetical protein